ncbi:MAG TPA: HAD-IC family P-type ATPase [Ktedonobacteraceae bacterium]
MSVAVAEELRVLHEVPGRFRVYLPTWSGQGKRRIEATLLQNPGVQRVQANRLTGNILLQFDPAIISQQRLLDAVNALELNTAEEEAEKELPPALYEKQGQTVRTRIAVRGLDRDPLMAKHIVEHLQRRPGVRASVSSLTGRVLVEFQEHQVEIEDLLADVADMELPPLPGEDRPAYPLDPGPPVQSAVRTVGAMSGLGLLVVRKLLGTQEPLPGAGSARQAASIIAILQGIPPFRYGLRKLLGRTAADLLFNIPGIITLTLANGFLGLIVTGAESVRLLSETIARRAAWRRHEERVAHAPSAQPNAVIRLDAGERTPLQALVLEGTGTALGRDGMPIAVAPGSIVPPGSRLYGGPFTLRLQSDESFQSFTPEPRPPLAPPLFYSRYLQIVGILSLICGAATALLTRSFNRTLVALLLVNPRPASVGLDGAELSASARIIRAGGIVVKTRQNRSFRLPQVMLLESARLLTNRLELVSAATLNGERDTTELLARAAGVALAAGSPWGGVFRMAKSASATHGSFDGRTATALLDGIRYTLGPVEDWRSLPEAMRLRQRGYYVLVLHCELEKRPLGLIALLPKLATGVQDLVQACVSRRVELAVFSSGDQIAVQALARRAGVLLIESDDVVKTIRARQAEGKLVAFVSDSASAAAGFDACDLAIGITDDHSRLPARADVLSPDLITVAAIVEACAARDATVRDSVVLSIISNLVGVAWGLRGTPGMAVAARVVNVASLLALADGWLRLRGGERPELTTARLVDPHPERWGQNSVEQTLHLLNTSSEGLTHEEALKRQQQAPAKAHRHPWFSALFDQLRSPLLGFLFVGAGLSMALGAVGDVVLIGITIVANVTIGVLQEHKASRVSETLEKMGTSQAQVLRAGQVVTVAANEVVPGDVLLLAPGDRVAADARLIHAGGLEIDEASLTGESLPVAKAPDADTVANRIVLDGSDVTTGTGRAVVVAVGRQTRMGATADALSSQEAELSPLGTRLSRLLSMTLPISIGSGVLVIAMGLLRGNPLTSMIATGVTLALAAIPEGLPLLTKVGEAGVAYRLAGRKAVVRRLTAIEALGRVDVACADKTGTMTQGRLAVSLVAGYDQEAHLPGTMPEDLRTILVTAALASPHPDASDLTSHPTDSAVVQAALAAGLGEQIGMPHDREYPFDPVRSFYATAVQGRMCLKGAPEALIVRCTTILRDGAKHPLDEAGRQKLLAASFSLAQRGLRVLMVAEGSFGGSFDNPSELTALGFLGISDPLRPTVRNAVRLCREAGVRVIMITGDHPETARAIGIEAGLLDGEGEVLTGTDLAELRNDDLNLHLERVTVIARATPIDKLHIVESLQRQGHTVAMTGDGVNDAPALRLANVGVAMGHTGTEVARQTADVVLIDDDFSTLVEALVEGRSFWRNIRRAIGLLLGGNLGELMLVVGASLLGLNFPLTASQLLVVNAITDVLPATAVALQQPEHRRLAGLHREGKAALDVPLRNDIVRRALSTALPALLAYGISFGSGTLLQARSVALASVILNQLAQTLYSGRSEEGLTRSVLGAVTGSVGVLFATFALSPVRNFLGLALPTPLGLMLIGGSALASVTISGMMRPWTVREPARPSSISGLSPSIA